MRRRHIHSSSPWRGWCAKLWLSHVELLKLHQRARRRRAAEWRFVLTQSKEFTTTPQQMCGAEKTWPCHRLRPITSSHGQGEQWCHHVVWFRLGLTSIHAYLWALVADSRIIHVRNDIFTSHPLFWRHTLLVTWLWCRSFGLLALLLWKTCPISVLIYCNPHFSFSKQTKFCVFLK